MKNKLLLLFLIIGLTLAFCLTANAMEGSGTENDPYIVETADDFISIQSNLSAHYKLNSDLSFTSTTGAIVEGTFKGVFDGNGHTIDLSIHVEANSTNTYDSLFGVVSGKIKNLTVTGSVYGCDKVSGVVGKLTGSGNVDNCVNYATITGKKNVGGIVGLVIERGTVTNCANFGSINGHQPINKGLDMGGIVGCLWSLSDRHAAVISNCFNAGDVHGQGYNAGGIVGHIQGGNLENVFNIGSVTITTNQTCAGSIIGQVSNDHNYYKVNGYFSGIDMNLLGMANGMTVTFSNPILESSGVAIYLGNGSGIRGEFHLNKEMYESLSTLAKKGGYELEYGALVSTKEILLSYGGDILSSEAISEDLIVYAPAISGGEEQYGYLDAKKGEGYHSYRFALTGFEHSKEAYNMEFVILGYLKITKGESERISTINTVLSDRLASSVGETCYNSVSIVRVAEAAIEDGDFVGNDAALGMLNQIAGLKDYETKFDIDGVIGYGHKKATLKKSISSDDTVVFQIAGTDGGEFTTYIFALAEGGYEKVAENVIGNVVSYTFLKEDTLIHAIFNKETGEARISKETLTAFPSFTQNDYTKTNDPSITQIKLEASIPEGMSYVIKLSDGTFFIIDGGWSDNNYNEADKLYDTLVNLAGGDDIVISGWIFTHCHGDHIGTFNLFVDKYHENVEIKELLYNFPSDIDISNSASAYMLNDTKQRYVEFRRVISTYLTDTKIVKLHTGYKFYYADLEIEIYQTLEDLYPQTVANYDFNSSSTVFRANIAGQSMLFIGDISDVGASKLNSTYGEELKSDFVQIAHHGLNSTTTIRNLYINAGAKYVFYPAPISWFESNSGNGANFYIQVESTSVKQIFVSGKSTFTLALPYAGTIEDGAKLPGFTVTEEEDRNEVARPTDTVIVPDAYFDLDLSGSAPTDSKGNATVTVTGGGISETTVTHGGKESTADAFTGDRYQGNYYLTLNFDEITTDSQMGELVMGSSTFEIFLSLDKLPGHTVGLITSCNGGGFTLYMRQTQGQLNFQIGSTYPNSNSDGGEGKGNYSAVTSMTNFSFPVAEAGTLLHIVGTYDKASNMMKLYINGIKVAESSYGTGNFKGGAGNDYVVGICYNPQWGDEAMSMYANYKLYEAKIYNVALTENQVAQEYWNCIDNLFKTEVK